MTIEKIREAYKSTPFKAFTLHLADGRIMPVRHPEFMAMFPGGRTVIVVLEDGSHHVIDLLLVVSIGFEPEVPGFSAAANGVNGDAH